MMRLAVLSLGIAGFFYMFNNPRYHVATFLMFAIVLGLIYELWVFLNRINREILRFYHLSDMRTSTRVSNLKKRALASANWARRLPKFWNALKN